MALFNCHECGADISDKAKMCIRCGAPISEPEKADDKRSEVYAEGTNSVAEDVFVNRSSKRQSIWSYRGAKLLLFFSIISMSMSVYFLMFIVEIYNIEQHLTKIDELTDNISEKITLMNSEVATMNGRVEDLIESADTTSSNVDVLFENFEVAYVELLDLHRRIDFITTGIDISEGAVTDKAVVKKAKFWEIQEENMIVGVIDIRPQPVYHNKFLGLGRFDLTDRELRSMLEELVNVVIQFLPASLIHNNETTFRIDITANNFNVASYQDGVITLEGE